MLRSRRVCGLLIATAIMLGAGQAATASAATVTVAPTVETFANCFPFGIAGGGTTWTPNAGFVYKNVPAFQLKAGEKLAFDLSAVNDVNIQLQIDMAPTIVNGGAAPAGGFTTVVSNTQTPANPRGDTVHGNFELQFTALAPFSFAGGGLIIRFSNPSAGYLADTTCTEVMTNSSGATDTSGLFVERFFSDADGLPPYGANTSTNNAGAFRLTLADPPAVAAPTGQRAAALEKCKKKHGKKKKKKCRKKANLLPV
jgi:hypothetical protein